MEKTLYEAIGVGRDASTDEIKAACLALGERYRPGYEAGETEAVNRFAEIERAYATLAHTKRRREYDHGLDHSWKKPSEPRFPVNQKVWLGVFVLAIVVAILGAAMTKQSGDLPPPLTEKELRDMRERAAIEAKRQEREVLVDSLSEAEKRSIRRAYNSIHPDLKR